MEYLHIKPQNLFQFKNDQNKIGEGSFGVVYKGIYCDTPVAVKNLKISVDENKEFEEFMQEMNLLSRLRHPNISSMIGIDDRVMILELYDGNAVKINTLEEMAIVARDCMRALSYMHKHGNCVKHGDIKPQNILIRRFGTDTIKQAYLADMGLSRACTVTGMWTGTPGYMPAVDPTDRMNDVYALAISLLNAYFPEHVHARFPDYFIVDNTFEYAGKTPPAIKNALSIMLSTVNHKKLTDAVKDSLLTHITGIWQSVIDNGINTEVVPLPKVEKLPELENILLAPDSLDEMNIEPSSLGELLLS